MTDQSTLAHEAGHVVGGLLAGHRVKAVRLGGTERTPGVEGLTSFDWSASPDVDLFGHLVSVLMGPMAEGKPPPGWPPLPDIENDAADGHVVTHLVIHLKLSKSDYMAAVALAADWLGDPLVKSAIAKVAHALGQTGFLTDAQEGQRSPSSRTVLKSGSMQLKPWQHWLLAVPPLHGKRNESSRYCAGDVGAAHAGRGVGSLR